LATHVRADWQTSSLGGIQKFGRPRQCPWVPVARPLSRQFAYVGRNDGTVTAQRPRRRGVQTALSAPATTLHRRARLFHLAQGAAYVYGYRRRLQATDFAYTLQRQPGQRLCRVGTAFSYHVDQRHSQRRDAVLLQRRRGVHPEHRSVQERRPGLCVHHRFAGERHVRGRHGYSFMYSTGAGRQLHGVRSPPLPSALVFGESFVGGSEHCQQRRFQQNILAGFH